MNLESGTCAVCYRLLSFLGFLWFSPAAKRMEEQEGMDDVGLQI